MRDVFENRTTSPLPGIYPGGVNTMKDSGFGKLGYAFAIEDPLGRLFLYEHTAKELNGVTEGELGAPSETAKGLLENDEISRIETIESCLVRCLRDEQGIDLRDAPGGSKLFISRISPIVVIDWVMTHTDNKSLVIPNTFAVATAFKANQRMAEFIALNAKSSHEASPGFFKPLHAVQRAIKEKLPCRPSFDIWFEQHLLTSPDMPHSKWEEVTIPEALDTDNGKWIGLRFKRLESLGRIVIQ